MSKERLEEIKNRDVSYLLLGTKFKDDWFWLIEQAERYDECRLDAMELYRQNKRYREALEFYADENNYDVDVHGDENMIMVEGEIMEDSGIKARQALESESDA